MRSVTEFLIIAVVVTLTPGPGTATILRVAARDGRRAAMSAIVGNSAGVLTWGILSALGVSSLILASQIAFDTLRVVGAAVLIVIGLRSLLQRGHATDPEAGVTPRRRAGWRSGLVTSVSNPKLAVFFVALFPQFLTRGSPVLPYALAMAGVIVLLDVLWFSTLAFAVDRARTLLNPGCNAAWNDSPGPSWSPSVFAWPPNPDDLKATRRRPTRHRCR
jgi:threonine/homoserine/homoserine lactone efflux protein